MEAKDQNATGAGSERTCKICGSRLLDNEELYWDTHCEQCACKSMDDWNEDFERQ